MSEIILYTTEDGKTKIDLRLDDGTVWLSQLQIAELFQTTKQNVSKHIQAIFKDGELSEEATVNQQLTVQKEGPREVCRYTTFYNVEREMRMADYVRELNSILSSTGRKLLDNAGKISSAQAKDKAKHELKKYKALNLDAVEKDYLKTIASLEKQAKKESRKKDGQA